MTSQLLRTNAAMNLNKVVIKIHKPCEVDSLYIILLQISCGVCPPKIVKIG